MDTMDRQIQAAQTLIERFPVSLVELQELTSKWEATITTLKAQLAEAKKDERIATTTNQITQAANAALEAQIQDLEERLSLAQKEIRDMGEKQALPYYTAISSGTATPHTRLSEALDISEDEDDDFRTASLGSQDGSPTPTLSQESTVEPQINEDLQVKERELVGMLHEEHAQKPTLDKHHIMSDACGYWDTINEVATSQDNHERFSLAWCRQEICKQIVDLKDTNRQLHLPNGKLIPEHESIFWGSGDIKDHQTRRGFYLRVNEELSWDHKLWDRFSPNREWFQYNDRLSITFMSYKSNVHMFQLRNQTELTITKVCRTMESDNILVPLKLALDVEYATTEAAITNIVFAHCKKRYYVSSRVFDHGWTNDVEEQMKEKVEESFEAFRKTSFVDNAKTIEQKVINILKNFLNGYDIPEPKLDEMKDVPIQNFINELFGCTTEEVTAAKTKIKQVFDILTKEETWNDLFPGWRCFSRFQRFRQWIGSVDTTSSDHSPKLSAWDGWALMTIWNEFLRVTNGDNIHDFIENCVKQFISHCADIFFRTADYFFVSPEWDVVEPEVWKKEFNPRIEIIEKWTAQSKINKKDQCNWKLLLVPWVKRGDWARNLLFYERPTDFFWFQGGLEMSEHRVTVPSSVRPWNAACGLPDQACLNLEMLSPEHGFHYHYYMSIFNTESVLSTDYMRLWYRAIAFYNHFERTAALRETWQPLKHALMHSNVPNQYFPFVHRCMLALLNVSHADGATIHHTQQLELMIRFFQWIVNQADPTMRAAMTDRYSAVKATENPIDGFTQRAYTLFNHAAQFDNGEVRSLLWDWGLFHSTEKQHSKSTGKLISQPKLPGEYQVTIDALRQSIEAVLVEAEGYVHVMHPTHKKKKDEVPEEFMLRWLMAHCLCASTMFPTYFVSMLPRSTIKFSDLFRYSQTYARCLLTMRCNGLANATITPILLIIADIKTHLERGKFPVYRDISNEDTVLPANHVEGCPHARWPDVLGMALRPGIQGHLVTAKGMRDMLQHIFRECWVDDAVQDGDEVWNALHWSVLYAGNGILSNMQRVARYWNDHPWACPHRDRVAKAMGGNVTFSVVNTRVLLKLQNVLMNLGIENQSLNVLLDPYRRPDQYFTESIAMLFKSPSAQPRVVIFLNNDSHVRTVREIQWNNDQNKFEAWVDGRRVGYLAQQLYCPALRYIPLRSHCSIVYENTTADRMPLPYAIVGCSEDMKHSFYYRIAPCTAIFTGKINKEQFDNIADIERVRLPSEMLRQPIAFQTRIPEISNMITGLASILQALFTRRATSADSSGVSVDDISAMLNRISKTSGNLEELQIAAGAFINQYAGLQLKSDAAPYTPTLQATLIRYIHWCEHALLAAQNALQMESGLPSSSPVSLQFMVEMSFVRFIMDVITQLLRWMDRPQAPLHPVHLDQLHRQLLEMQHYCTDADPPQFLTKHYEYLFVAQFGYLPTQEQLSLTRQITEEMLAKSPNNFTIYQLAMGKGKSAVITPLLVLAQAANPPGTDQRIVVPSHLVTQTHCSLNAVLIYVPYKVYIVGIEDALARAYQAVKPRAKEEDKHWMQLPCINDEVDTLLDPQRFVFNYIEKPVAAFSNARKAVLFAFLVMGYRAETKDAMIYITDYPTVTEECDLLQSSFSALLPGRDFGLKPQAQDEDETRNVVIPYLRKDTPLPQSEFSSILIRLRLTIEYNGHQARAMPMSSVPNAEEDLLRGAIVQRHHIVQLFKKRLWKTVEKKVKELSNIMNVVLDLPKQNQITPIPTISGEINEVYERAILSDRIIEQAEFDTEKPDFRRTIAEARAVFYIVTLHYLDKQFLQVAKEQGQASGLTLTGERFPHAQAGFSGTVSIPLHRLSGAAKHSFHTIQHDHDEAVGVALALQGFPQKHDDMVKSVSDTEPAQVLRELCQTFTEYKAFTGVVDIAGCFLYYSNDTIAQHIQLAAGPNSVCAFADESDELRMVQVTGTTEFNPSIVHDSRYHVCYYYDQRHIVGTDIPQRFTGRAIVLITPETTLTEFAQGIFRFRKLNKGTTMQVWVLAKDDTSTLTPDGVHSMLVENEWKSANTKQKAMKLHALKDAVRNYKATQGTDDAHVEKHIQAFWQLRETANEGEEMKQTMLSYLQKNLGGLETIETDSTEGDSDAQHVMDLWQDVQSLTEEDLRGLLFDTSEVGQQQQVSTNTSTQTSNQMQRNWRKPSKLIPNTLTPKLLNFNAPPNLLQFYPRCLSCDECMGFFKKHRIQKTEEPEFCIQKGTDSFPLYLSTNVIVVDVTRQKAIHTLKHLVLLDFGEFYVVESLTCAWYYLSTIPVYNLHGRMINTDRFKDSKPEFISLPRRLKKYFGLYENLKTACTSNYKERLTLNARRFMHQIILLTYKQEWGLHTQARYPNAFTDHVNETYEQIFKGTQAGEYEAAFAEAVEHHIVAFDHAENCTYEQPSNRKHLSTKEGWNLCVQRIPLTSSATSRDP